MILWIETEANEIKIKITDRSNGAFIIRDTDVCHLGGIVHSLISYYGYLKSADHREITP